MTDKVQQFIYKTLAPLPYAVCQPPGQSTADTYLTFNETQGSFYQASNDPTRIRHLLQLHAFSRLEGGEHRAAFFQALELLKAAGVRVGLPEISSPEALFLRPEMDSGRAMGPSSNRQSRFCGLQTRGCAPC